MAGAKSTLIAGAALAAAGLFGSLPYHGATQAQGTPVQYHDVALVDTTSDLIGTETSLDDSLYSGLGSNETGLYTETVAALGGGATGATEANELLGATTTAPFDGLFDGAYNSAGGGFLLDAWAAEDELNQLLGIPAATSQADILADIAKDPVVLPVGDTLPTAGAAFDTDLMSLANGDYAAASTEFTNYLDGLGDLSGLGGILGDLGGSGTDSLSSLLGVLGTFVTDLGTGLF